MITAVDTNVLIDVFRDDPEYCDGSAAALRDALQNGRVTVCEVVWAELAAVFPSLETLERNMERLGVEFVSMEKETAALAGELWRRYRLRGGKRQRLVADFMIGAHALRQGDVLLTRDRGFYRRCFKSLNVVDPAR